ncbi:actin cytoskeleton organization protein [Rickenella mellea]|uniref:Actin cytoskeleton organization protein n=1 Tax=Rickenella mellea TaxID=50990 RepID=A0A4Y7Q2H8_9AGAM|nr:actin cytoskeleton organization protein [Rickenella mellea]
MSQAALERQIRPIYDALDTGSNKSAIQACNKLLKKHPNLSLVKALKALAVVRTNKIEESLPICDEVLASKPTDLDTLNAMMHVLRALGRHTDMVNMFDEAYKRQPTNEDLGAQSFFANVRAGRWKAAQQVATRMHKQFKSDRFIYWSVMSAVLQAKDPSTPPTTRPILFQLAHRLLLTTPVPPTATADRLHLHVTVLRELSLYDEARQLLETTVGKAIVKTSIVVDELRREVAVESGRWKEEGREAARRLVEEKDRNWLEFRSVLDSAFSDIIPGEDIPEPVITQVKETRDLLAGIAEADGRTDRGAALALVELEWRAREKGVSSHSNELLKMLRKYVEKFGDKACCFEDIRQFVAFKGSEDGLRSWVSYLDEHQHSVESATDLQRSINTHKLRRNALTTAELTPDLELERALTYTKQYLSALPLGKELPETELQPADDLILLAAQAFVSTWTLAHDETFLYNAVSALEYALTRSKHSYLIRLHLIRIYRLLGAPSLAWKHYHDMNVKQVQNDTLSHFTLARASTFSLVATGDLQFSQEILESSQIYSSNSSDTADYIVRAFGAEKYSQIPDFISFEERLDNSLQRDLIKIEHVLMRLTHEPIMDVTDTELIELKFIFDRLHFDNRDFDVLLDYQPRVQTSFNEQTLMLGSSPGLGWLMTFLRIYIRVFQQATDIDDTVEDKLLIGDRPKVNETPENKIPLTDRLLTRKPEELAELTKEELSLFEFAMALCDWLGPYHDHARPPAAVVLAEAAKQAEERSGKVTKSSGTSSNGSSSPNGNGHAKKSEPPAVKPPPEVVTRFFDDMAKRFEEVADGKHLPCEVLHVATLTQEALIILVLATMRFKTPAVVKVNKFGGLTGTFKELRTNALAVVKNMAGTLTKLASREDTSEQRKAFVVSCQKLQTCPEFEHDFILGVAKRVGEARKRVMDGVSKGMLKVGQNLP